MKVHLCANCAAPCVDVYSEIESRVARGGPTRKILHMDTRSTVRRLFGVLATQDSTRVTLLEVVSWTCVLEECPGERVNLELSSAMSRLQGSWRNSTRMPTNAESGALGSAALYCNGDPIQ